MTPKADPCLLFVVVVVVAAVSVLAAFGSGSILHFLRKLSLHYLVEWILVGAGVLFLVVKTTADQICRREETKVTSSRTGKIAKYYAKMGLFGKGRDPKVQIREWTKKLRQEQNQVERQINQTKRMEDKVAVSLKQAAKKGDKDSCRILAKEVVRARKAVNKMYSSKARINSVRMQMENQLAVVKVTGELERSTEVMRAMTDLVKIPELQNAMMTMSKEMAKAGIIEELVEETMEQMEDDDIEEAADKEIENVLWELTKGQLGEAPDAVAETLPSGLDEALGEEAGATAAAADAVDDVDEMQARLASLRN